MFDKVVLAGAPWCSSCKGFKDVLLSLGIDYQYVDLDTEEGAAYAKQHGIRSLPTTHFILGNKTEVVVGSKDIQFVKGLLKEFKE